MPKPVKNKPKPRCVACGGTGRNSKGGECLPCARRKVVKVDKP